jgi:tetratricopeptide (TPR) repeat protein
MHPLAAEAYQRASTHALSRERRALLTFKLGRAHAFEDPRGVDFLYAALRELDPTTQAIEVAQARAVIGRYHHYLAQHAQAVALLEQARRLAEPLDDPETLTRIYSYLAAAYQGMARAEEGMTWARQCLSLGERKQYPEALATGYGHLAECLSLLGRWDESLAYSARNAQVAERIRQQHHLAWSHHDRATALYGRGDLAGALEAAQIALTITEVTGERRLAALVRSLLSQIQTDLAQDEAARAEAQVAVTGADELGNCYLRGFTRGALAYFYTQREEWDLAADVLTQSATILEGTDQGMTPLRFGAMAAYVAWQQGRTEEATNTIGATLELARTANSPHYEAIASRVHGQMLAEQESWSEAAQSLDAAVSVLEQLGSRLELGRALHARGVMQNARGKVTAARADVEDAHAIFTEVGAGRDVERAARYLQSMCE